MNEEIRELRDQTARTRLEFLRVELETCLTALGMARFELSIGNLDVVRREVDVVTEGITTVERFLPDLAAEQRSQFEARITDLRAMLESLKRELESATGRRGSGTS